MSHENDDTTLPSSDGVSAKTTPMALGLCLAWSVTEPQRAGEFAPLKLGKTHVLGRGAGDGSMLRVEFGAQRPGSAAELAPLVSKTLSRDQLRVSAGAKSVEVERVGRGITFHNGEAVERATMKLGDTLRIGNDVVVACVERPVRWEEPRFFGSDGIGRFARADRFGIVGESAACWRLREQLAFAALSDAHVFIHGPSGVGKELAARAVHGLSTRSNGPFVARNASTLPASIAAAELFGNRRDYPNPGTPDRPGLVGEADGGVLLLDELGELALELQTQLLRFLDAGEYQRIGDSTTRHSNVRLVGATNRQPRELREDLLARFKVRVQLPELNTRRTDIPMLCRELVTRASDQSPQLAARFVRDTPQGPEIRMSATLADLLVRHVYRLHVRELDMLLWSSMSESPGESLEFTPGVEQAMLGAAPPSSHAAAPSDGPSREEIKEALRLEGGSRTKAARRLKLPSRFVLYRLMKAHGISD